MGCGMNPSLCVCKYVGYRSANTALIADYFFTFSSNLALKHRSSQSNRHTALMDILTPPHPLKPLFHALLTRSFISVKRTCQELLFQSDKATQGH